MYQEIEDAIVERLRAVLPADVTVATENDVDKVETLRNMAPAVWVIYNGATPAGNIPPGRVQKVAQEWMIVSAAKSAKGRGKGTEARKDAASIAALALEALLGFHIGGGKYLHLSDAPPPTYDAGYCHVPLAFENEATFKGREA